MLNQLCQQKIQTLLFFCQWECASLIWTVSYTEVWDVGLRLCVSVCVCVCLYVCVLQTIAQRLSVVILIVESWSSYWTICMMSSGTMITIFKLLDSNQKWHSNKKCPLLLLSNVMPISSYQFIYLSILFLYQERLIEIQDFLFQGVKCVPSGVKDYVKQQHVSFTAGKKTLKGVKRSALKVIVSCVSLHATILAKTNEGNTAKIINRPKWALIYIFTSCGNSAVGYLFTQCLKFAFPLQWCHVLVHLWNKITSLQ